jgi:hypothetical protein
MAIKLATGFSVGSQDVIDERQKLTKAEMLALDENVYPEQYFCICVDDGKLYTYNINNTVDAETGKFRIVSGEGGVGDEYLKIDSEEYQTISEHSYDMLALTDEEIAELFELSEEQCEELAKLIDDNVVSKQKLYSSFKVVEEIKKCLEDSKAYAEGLIGNISSISLEVVSILPTTNIKENVIYILQGTPNTLNVYSNGAFVEVGDLNVDFSDFYTKIEIDALIVDFAKKTEVILQDNLVQDLSSPSPSQVISTNGLKLELDKKANQTDLEDVLVKTQLVTSISASSTDEQVASAKAVFDTIPTNDEIKKLIRSDVMICPIDKSPLEFAMENTETNTTIHFYSWGNTTSDRFKPYSTYVFVRMYDANVGRLFAIDNEGNTGMRRYKKNATPAWSGWKRINGTSVADVVLTELPALNSDDESKYVYESAMIPSYIVRNGICYMSGSIKCLSANTTASISGVPKSAFVLSHGEAKTLDSTDLMSVYVTDTGILYFRGGNPNVSYRYSFSYPVAE